jgi:hypothetical protein
VGVGLMLACVCRGCDDIVCCCRCCGAVCRHHAARIPGKKCWFGCSTASPRPVRTKKYFDSSLLGLYRSPLACCLLWPWAGEVCCGAVVVSAKVFGRSQSGNVEWERHAAARVTAYLPCIDFGRPRCCLTGSVACLQYYVRRIRCFIGSHPLPSSRLPATLQ